MSTRLSSRGWWVAGSVLVVLGAGCSSSSQPVTRLGPTTIAPAITSTVPTTAPATTASAATTQTVTVIPSSGLKSPQTVLVQAAGFSSAESLVITECAAKGAATGPGDCDLANMQSVTSDANGRVSVQFTVSKGPFGANNVICGPIQPCLVSVTQATLSPTQEADARISFV